MSQDENYSSYEERILSAALRLAQSADDPNVSSEAVSEIVLCARGMLRRVPPDTAYDIEQRRRLITLVDVPGVDFPESHVVYDDPKDGER